MDEPIRVGIIGAGWFAAFAHVPALQAVDGVEIVAACRRSPDRLKEFADKTGVPQTFTGHEEMLDSVALDAVVVCSPHALHYEHVKAALERGLHVLTDKPLAIRSADAEELIALAEAKNRKLAVYFGPAYNAMNRYVAQAIREERLGRLAYLEASMFANPDALGFFGHAPWATDNDEFVMLPTAFRADPVLGGGGYLQDVGNHAFSALLIGTGLRVQTVSAVMDDPNLDLRTTVTLRFTNGALGTVTVCGDLRPPVRGYWGHGRFAVVGDLGGYWRDDVTGALRYQVWGREPAEIEAHEMPAPTNPDENFLRALRGEVELIAPATEALEVVRVMEAAYQSARTGRTVTLAGMNAT